jgi:hypothetical protein
MAWAGVRGGALPGCFDDVPARGLGLWRVCATLSCLEGSRESTLNSRKPPCAQHASRCA